jgi:hypothetical protein
MDGSMAAKRSSVRFRLRGRRGRGRAGVTVIEVVVALAILTLVAGMTAGVIGLLQSWRDIERTKLAGYEAAHRLIVQFNEDPRSVKRARYPVEVDGELFDYEIEESILRIEDVTGEARVEPSSISMADARSNPTLALSNPLWRVEVRVYARHRNAGYAPGEEVARLSRLYNLLGTDGDALYERIIDMFGEDLDRQ